MWNELYNETTEPSLTEIEDFINNPLFGNLCECIESTYKVSRKTDYSKCTWQPGWNIKYKKSGKTLCTLYPMQDYFIALIVIGNKEQTETELIMQTLTEYIQGLYEKTKSSSGGRWLMVEVRDKEIFDDCIKLIDMRARKKQREVLHK